MSSSLVTIRPLDASDADSFKALRLMAIASSPTSVWPTHQEEAAHTREEVEAKIQSTMLQMVFGVFVGSKLIGIAGLRREALRQICHKGWIWGVFVDPGHRGNGHARKLLEVVIAHARTIWRLDQLLLCVNNENIVAKTLYESLGFVIFGVEPRAMKVGEKYFDEQHMVLALTPLVGR